MAPVRLSNIWSIVERRTPCVRKFTNTVVVLEALTNIVPEQFVRWGHMTLKLDASFVIKGTEPRGARKNMNRIINGLLNIVMFQNGIINEDIQGKIHLKKPIFLL